MSQLRQFHGVFVTTTLFLLISGASPSGAHTQSLSVNGDLYGSWLAGNVGYIDIGAKAKADWNLVSDHHLKPSLKTYYWDDFNRGYLSIETSLRYEFYFSKPVYLLTQTEFRKNDFKNVSREFDFLAGVGLNALEGFFLEYRMGHRFAQPRTRANEHFLIQSLYGGYFLDWSATWRLSLESLLDSTIHQYGSAADKSGIEKSRLWASARVDYFFSKMASLYVSLENSYFFEKFPGVSQNDLSVRYGIHISWN